VVWVGVAVWLIVFVGMLGRSRELIARQADNLGGAR